MRKRAFKVGAVNVATASRAWLILFPSMEKVDFSQTENVREATKGLALTKVVAVLVRVPVMLSLIRIMKRWHDRVDARAASLT